MRPAPDLLKIDVHTHILPERLPDFRKVPGGDRFVQIEHPTPRSGRARMIVNGSVFREIESNSWNVEARLAECDAAGVGGGGCSAGGGVFGIGGGGGCGLAL